ncbi:translation initiation factor IF-2 subunit gamma [Ferroplasma acidiphilum]|uniref:protein-synthesizing GTPase n=1 Tax=Ferroplasma acidiphilum TaxID=74969 RepID=A0A7K4FL70_9ARCH|nr:translation initiation factor IF-2 subunit gamma [Ferroplasma acidiphilum]NOL59783.1 translation initiation factor IF-2 subunit gamma [Ferroplasma acidiphilum]
MEQPSVNIGMVGHVDHGKSTLTFALTGKKTDVHSEEVKRGISIKLGYADTPIYRCTDETGKEFYSNKKNSDNCQLSRVISIVDAPGHETLMATMLAGSAIMNGAILVIAANEECPQPQTREHLTALEIMGIKEIIVVQNKIDLVTRERAMESYKEIKDFLKGSIAENAPVIPVSAYHNTNIDVVFEAIEKIIKTPPFNDNDSPMMYIARSFDINKPGTKPSKLKGGVLGGALIRGKLTVGDEIEIAPGVQITKGNKTTWDNVTTKITSLMAGSSSYESILPGGLAAVGTELDPFLTKGDSFTGRIIGLKGNVPKTVFNMEMDIHLLDRVVGFDEEVNVEPLKSNEMIMLTVGTANTIGTVTSIKDKRVGVTLKYPVAASINDRMAIGRRISNRWRLIGYGSILTIY